MQIYSRSYDIKHVFFKATTFSFGFIKKINRTSKSEIACRIHSQSASLTLNDFSHVYYKKINTTIDGYGQTKVLNQLIACLRGIGGGEASGPADRWLSVRRAHSNEIICYPYDLPQPSLVYLSHSHL